MLNRPFQPQHQHQWRRHTFAVRLLSTDDIDAIEQLSHAIKVSLPHGFLREKTAHERMSYLTGQCGVAFGVFEPSPGLGTEHGTDELVAMALVRIPTKEAPNPPDDVPYVAADEWQYHTAMLENAMVLPAKRGRGYQRALIESRIRFATKLGMRWVFTGVLLRNTMSLRNLLASDMVIVGTRKMNGEQVIGLVHRTWHARSAREASRADTLGVITGSSVIDGKRVVSIDDALAHERALADGYVGARLLPSGRVLYQRFCVSEEMV